MKLIKRDFSLQLIRVIAMFMIILDHILSRISFPMQPLIIQVTNSGVFIFLLISGFLYGKKDIDNWRKWFINRLFRICLPLWIFMVVDFIVEAILWNIWDIKYVFIYAFNLQGILGFNIGGMNLWFLTLIMICYLITPLLQRIRKKNPTKGVGIVTLVCAMIIQAVLAYTTDIGMVGGHTLSWCTIAVGMYVAGYFVGDEIFSDKIVKFRIITFTVLAVCASGVVLFFNLKFNNQIIYDRIIIYYGMVVIDLWICTVVYKLGKYIKGDFTKRVINHLDTISYEFYIVHGLIIASITVLVLIKVGSMAYILSTLMLSWLVAIVLHWMCHLVDRIKYRFHDMGKKVILFFFIVLFFYIVKNIVSPVFQTCDDAIIRDIIAGNYSGTPDGHAVFVGYPLAWLMSCLYKMLPDIEWYGNIWSAGLVVSVFVIIKDILFEIKHLGRFVKIAISIFILMGIYMPIFIVQQFTILSGVLAGTSIYFVLSGNKKKYVFCFMLFSFLVRADMFFVAVPFILLGELYFLYQKRFNYNIKDMIRQMLAICLMVICVFGIGKSSEHFAYDSEQWKNYMTYNKSRAMLYDYTDLMNNDSYIEDFKRAGINENTYFILKKYMIYFDNDINKNTLDIAKSVIDNKNETGLISKAQNSIIKVEKRSIKDYWQYNLIVWMLIILILLSLVIQKRRRESIFVILSEIGREIIVFFLQYNGRLPDRVYIGIFMLELFFLIKIIMSETIIITNLKCKKICVLCVVFLLCMCQNYKVQLSHRNYMIEAYDNINSKIVEYCRENTENIYFVNMPTNQYVFENRYISDNMCILSMYLTGSELMNRYTLDLSTRDIAETLLQYDNYRYIVDAEEDIEGLSKYFEYRFDDCDVEIEDYIKIDSDKTFSVIKLK